eukprot:gene20468-22484_t
MQNICREFIGGTMPSSNALTTGGYASDTAYAEAVRQLSGHDQLLFSGQEDSWLSGKKQSWLTDNWETRPSNREKEQGYCEEKSWLSNGKAECSYDEEMRRSCDQESLVSTEKESWFSCIEESRISNSETSEVSCKEKSRKDGYEQSLNSKDPECFYNKGKAMSCLPSKHDSCLSNKQELQLSDKAEARFCNEKDEEKGLSSNSLTQQYPSYTQMIATAILNGTTAGKPLKQIYAFMDKHYKFLAQRGRSWKNSVRHTLSLNECFVKLHRPDNGKICDWTIHAKWLEKFRQGNFKRVHQKRNRTQQRTMAHAFMQYVALEQTPPLVKCYSDCMYQTKSNRVQCPVNYNKRYDELNNYWVKQIDCIQQSRDCIQQPRDCTQESRDYIQQPRDCIQQSRDCIQQPRECMLQSNSLSYFDLN